MKVTNIHHRIIARPITEVGPLLSTISNKNSQIWPVDKWPPMRFKEGLTIGARGGHGPIRYVIETIDPGRQLRFRFTRPSGFVGYHALQLEPVAQNRTQIIHTIQMRTMGLAAISWPLVIRWLHDALIEDAFDKIENQLTGSNKSTPWNWWVRVLRWILK